MKHNIITSSVLPIASTVITAFQVTHNWITCIVFLALSFVLLYYVIVRFKDNRQDRISGIVCIVIMVLSSGIGLWNSFNQNQRDERWQAYLLEERDTKLENLISKANANDGPAQMELSDYYYSNSDYKKSREYAQMAADNGNIKGYARLVDIDYWGRGCVPNHERAFKNILRGQHVDYAHFDYEGITDNLSASQRAQYLSTETKQKRMLLISNEIGNAIESGRSSAKAVFAKYHDEIVELYNDEFVPAIEALYIESWLNHDEQDMYEYAKQLYAVNRIPTGPMSRYRFLLMLHQREEDGTEYYDDYIAENNYISAYAFDYEITRDRSEFTSSLLFQEYRYFRAQYQWYKDLSEGKIKEVDYFITADKPLPELYRNARILLEKNIEAIQERENSL